MSKVLIVEDDNILSKAIRMSLEKENFVTITAEDGEDALVKVKQFKPDLVLLDLVIPKKTGEDVLRFLKNDPLTKDIPVLVITVKTASEAIDRCIALGAKGYFMKSDYTPEDIVSKVRKTLSVGALN